MEKLWRMDPGDEPKLYMDIRKEAVRVLSQHYAQSGDFYSSEALNQKCFSAMRHKCDKATMVALDERVKRIEASASAKRAKARRDEQDAIRHAIATGVRPIESLEDARAYFRPDVVSQVLWNRPPADGKYHEMYTIISHETPLGLLSWWPDSWVRARSYSPHIAVGALFPRPTFVQEGFQPGNAVTVVARYTGYRDIRLANGTPITVPVFEDAYIFRY